MSIIERRWSDWITDKIPNLGMYVQVESEHELTKELRKEEGIIGRVIGDCAYFIGEDPTEYCPWFAVRWRFLITGELDFIERKKELPVD